MNPPNNSKKSQTNRINILFIARTYPPLVGGMEKFASDFYTFMNQYVNTELIANRVGKKNIIPFFFRVMIYVIFHAKDYDIIHFNDAILAPLLPIIRIFSNAKITFTVHGLDIVYEKFGYQSLIVPFLKKADRIFPVSRYTKEQCINRNLPAKKLSVITNGLDFSQRITITDKDKRSIHSKLNVDIENKKILLTLGRLIPRKGHSWFIENVFTKLPKNIVYLIAGDGPEYPHIQSIVNNLGLSDRIFLLGYVSEEEKAYLFQLADLFIMPNITDKNDQEGFGIVLLEAGSYSLPVVASNIEGITDAVIDGVSGKLVEEKNAHDFINTILNIELDRNIIFEKLRQQYDWQIISEKYYDEFIQLTQS